MSTFMLSRVLILGFQSVAGSPGKLDRKHETEGKCYLNFSRNPHPPPPKMFHFQGLHLDSNTTSRSQVGIPKVPLLRVEPGLEYHQQIGKPWKGFISISREIDIFLSKCATFKDWIWIPTTSSDQDTLHGFSAFSIASPLENLAPRHWSVML